MRNSINKWKQIDSYSNCLINGSSISLEKYIEVWDKLANFRQLTEVKVKHFYFNTGNTAYSNAKSYRLTERGRYVTTYVIRERNDGFNFMVLEWTGTFEEWENYDVLDERKSLSQVMDRFNDM